MTITNTTHYATHALRALAKAVLTECFTVEVEDDG